jgi:hypothetical protein
MPLRYYIRCGIGRGSSGRLVVALTTLAGAGLLLTASRIEAIVARH